MAWGQMVWGLSPDLSCFFSWSLFPHLQNGLISSLPTGGHGTL